MVEVFQLLVDDFDIPQEVGVHRVSLGGSVGHLRRLYDRNASQTVVHAFQLVLDDFETRQEVAFGIGSGVSATWTKCRRNELRKVILSTAPYVAEETSAG